MVWRYCQAPQFPQETKNPASFNCRVKGVYYTKKLAMCPNGQRQLYYVLYHVTQINNAKAIMWRLIALNGFLVDSFAYLIL